MIQNLFWKKENCENLVLSNLLILNQFWFILIGFWKINSDQ